MLLGKFVSTNLEICENQSPKFLSVTTHFGGAQAFAVATLEYTEIWRNESMELMKDMFSIILYQFWIQLINLSKIYFALKKWSLSNFE